MKISSFAISILLLLVFSGCKEDIGPQSIITGKIYHHDWNVPGLMVYLRHNSTDYPGSDSRNYSDSMKVRGQFAEFSFRKLSAGDYYIMAFGYDTLFKMNVRGYKYVRVNSDDEIVTLNLEVSE